VKNIYKISLIWIAPFVFVLIYDTVHYLVHLVVPHLVGVPGAQTVYSATLMEVISSPLWVLAGFSFTYFFGGVVVVYLMRAFAHNRLLKRKLIVSLPPNATIDDISKESVSQSLFRELSVRNFSVCLVLTLALNLSYVLLIQRYFQGALGLPTLASSGPFPRIFQYFLSPQLILVEFLLALLLLPLVALVVPMLLGRVQVRQVDGARVHTYWLSYVYSVAGGASLVLFLLNVFESKGTTGDFIVASTLIYAILSWYAALGINLGIPRAERRLAKELAKMRGKDNFYFGQIFVGASREEAEQV
jgi:hypothetical protein